MIQKGSMIGHVKLKFIYKFVESVECTSGVFTVKS